MRKGGLVQHDARGVILKRSILISLLTLYCVLPSHMMDLIGLRGETMAAGPTIEAWTRTARIGGAAVWIGMQAQEIEQLISSLVAQNVTVVEADSDLSNYLTDVQFAQELILMGEFSAAAHAAGLRVVWYYPTLEVLTNNGANLAHTMFKDHPDWIQVGLDGSPNVFYGGGGRVFWVPPGTESAWMSPSSGYRQYYMKRVKQIAATGIDGLWLDVPLLNDIAVTWADFHPSAIAQFTSDTGFVPPQTQDWTDPRWRRWISWRHQQISGFLSDVALAGQSVNPKFTTITETVTMDYNAGTSIALDGADLKYIDGVTHIWEIDVLSDSDAMRHSLEDDWVSLIAMNKFARAASGNKPSWVFTYGRQSDDAELVMAEALAARNNPFELKIPEMTSTVGAVYRTRMFGWIKDNAPYLFATKSGSQVAVLYSSPSRDFVDQAKGLGLYVTTTSSDTLWWSRDAIDSAYNRQYLAEYRGVVKLLVHNHIPFDIVVRPDLLELAGYSAVILPDVEAMPDGEAAILKQYTNQGGNLIITGPNPSGLEVNGAARPEYALVDLLGFSKTDPLPVEKQKLYGQGKVFFNSALLGRQYFVTSDAAASAALLTALQQANTSSLSTTADRRVHIELSQTAGKAVLQFVNFIGVDGSFSVVPTSFSVSLAIPEGKQVSGVALTSPDLPTTALGPIGYSEAGKTITFNVDLHEYSMVVVSLQDVVAAGNRPPVAGDDKVSTRADTPLTIVGSDLLANDIDPDGDTLEVVAVDAISVMGGTIADNGNRTYTYSPPISFSGDDGFDYKISDGKGGTASASVHIAISPPTVAQSFAYSPKAVAITVGSYDFGTLASLAASDLDTYDMKAAAVNQGRVIDWNATTTISNSQVSYATLTVTYKGQYSQTNVSQEVFLYNYRAKNWELVDTHSVGNQTDVTVKVVISSDSQRYISATGEMKVRVRGFRATNAYDCWANSLAWELVGAAGGGSVNTPPMAGNDSYSTDAGTPLTISGTDLLANDTDPDGDTLSMTAMDVVGSNGGTIVDNGNGTYTYTPPAGFSGTDTFTYQISDGKASSIKATVTITINPKIVIDGNLSDWNGGATVQDGRDVADTGANLLDILELRLANDTTNLFVAYRNRKPVVLNWAYTLYLDVDRNPTTGFSMWDIGADYLLQGNILYLYAGTGVDWSWTTVGQATSAVNGTIAELAVPLSRLGNPTPAALNYMFAGDNTAYPGGTGFDMVPEVNTGGSTYLTYKLESNNGSGGGGSNTNPPGGIRVDGSLDDWIGVAAFPPDPVDAAGSSNKVDLRQFYFTNDAGNFYLALQNEHPVELNWAYTLYLDTDGSAMTGFAMVSIGADYALQGRSLYRYAGNGADWKWTLLGDVTVAVQGNVVEYSFPRADIGNPQTLRMQFWGDNAAYPGGAGVDTFPDDPNMFLTYNTLP